MKIDHVIYVTGDLEAGTARCEAEYGARATGGGRHDGHGTHNRIIPFGRGYLEVLAIADPDEAARSPVGSAFQRRLETVGDGLFGWAIVTDDIEAVAERIGSELIVLTRDGFSARLTGIAETIPDPGLPFFLQRDHAVPDPGLGGAGSALAWVEVSVDEAKLRERLGDADIDVRIAEGTPGVLRFGLSAGS